MNHGYTWSAITAVAVAVLFDLVLLRTFVLRTRLFWASYGIVLLFQLIVNGILTGLQIVRYDPRVIIGWRVVYAPVEDIAYGFALVTLTIAAWIRLGRRSASAATDPV